MQVLGCGNTPQLSLTIRKSEKSNKVILDVIIDGISRELLEFKKVDRLSQGKENDWKKLFLSGTQEYVYVSHKKLIKKLDCPEEVLKKQCFDDLVFEKICPEEFKQVHQERKFKELNALHTDVSGTELKLFIEEIEKRKSHWTKTTLGYGAHLNRLKTQLMKTVTFFEDGDLFIHLGKKLATGGTKTVTVSVLYNQPVLMACLRIITKKGSRYLPSKERIERDLAYAKRLEKIPGFAQYYKVFTDLDSQGREKIFIFMPFYAGGDLNLVLTEPEFRSKITPAVKFRMIEGLLQAICKAHSKNVILNDLKEANILFKGFENITDDDFLVITDFDQCSDADKPLRADYVQGTYAYIPPDDSLDNVVLTSDDMKRKDTFAFGCILWRFLNGNACPIILGRHVAHRKEALQKIRATRPIPGTLKDLMHQCFKTLPERPTSTEALNYFDAIKKEGEEIFKTNGRELVQQDSDKFAIRLAQAYLNGFITLDIMKMKIKEGLCSLFFDKSKLSQLYGKIVDSLIDLIEKEELAEKFANGELTDLLHYETVSLAAILKGDSFVTEKNYFSKYYLHYYNGIIKKCLEICLKGNFNHALNALNICLNVLLMDASKINGEFAKNCKLSLQKNLPELIQKGLIHPSDKRIADLITQEQLKNAKFPITEDSLHMLAQAVENNQIQNPENILEESVKPYFFSLKDKILAGIKSTSSINDAYVEFKVLRELLITVGPSCKKMGFSLPLFFIETLDSMGTIESDNFLIYTLKRLPSEYEDYYHQVDVTTIFAIYAEILEVLKVKSMKSPLCINFLEGVLNSLGMLIKSPGYISRTELHKTLTKVFNHIKFNMEFFTQDKNVALNIPVRFIEIYLTAYKDFKFSQSLKKLKTDLENQKEISPFAKGALVALIRGILLSRNFRSS